MRARIALPPSRSGIGPKIMLPGRERAIEGAGLLEIAPDWEMDDITARLWPGPRRIASYDMEFPEIDRKTIAVELQDFVRAVESGEPPEVGAEMGMKALALFVRNTGVWNARRAGDHRRLVERVGQRLPG